MILEKHEDKFQKKKLIVIGGGAAGFFCAINAAESSDKLEVTILEKSNKLLTKVKVSGGGRCNVTHACFDITEMAERYPRGKNFIKKAFHQFFTSDTIRWFDNKGVKLKHESDGRMFPVTDNSQTIIDCFIQEVNKLGITLRMNAEVKSIKKNDAGFQLFLSNGKSEFADFICVACGGYPKTQMFGWLVEMGHSFSEPVPSLFTFNLSKHPITTLMGISVESIYIKIEGTNLAETGPLLITHWGLSGPAILRLSAWGARELAMKNYIFRVHINWTPNIEFNQWKKIFQDERKNYPAKKINNFQHTNLPHRLWKFLLTQAEVDENLVFGNLPTKIENKVIALLTDYILEVNGKTTFKEEFVTAGGIQLSEINNQTMMSKKVDRLFFAGEILDVDGITGGYNFQHAWTSGWIAAKSIANIANTLY